MLTWIFTNLNLWHELIFIIKSLTKIFTWVAYKVIISHTLYKITSSNTIDLKILLELLDKHLEIMLRDFFQRK